MIRILSRTEEDGTLLVTLHLPDTWVEPFFFQVLTLASELDVDVRARKEYVLRGGKATYTYSLFYWGPAVMQAEAQLQALVLVRNTAPVAPPRIERMAPRTEARAVPTDTAESDVVETTRVTPPGGPLHRLVHVSVTESGTVTRIRLPHMTEVMSGHYGLRPGQRVVTMDEHRRFAGKGVYFATATASSDSAQGGPREGDY